MSPGGADDAFPGAPEASGRWPTARLPVREQVEQLRADAANLSLLARAGDAAAAEGAGLALAHGALVLAVTPTAAAGDRRRRRAALRAVAPTLARAGLGHVAPLVATALAHDADPALVLVSPGRRQ